MIELLCQKMPLSSLLRGLLERYFAAERLEALFEAHAREQYTRDLLFSTVCDRLLSVVLRVYPSTHAAYQDRRPELNVSVVALYDKLKGIEVAVSAARVRETARDLSDLLDALDVQPEPWLPGYAVRILDGNCLEASEKRLGVHPGLAAAAVVVRRHGSLPFGEPTPLRPGCREEEGQRLFEQRIEVEGRTYR
ncbi:hypothetical protein ACWJKU_08200 [Methylocaldum sp. MU1018]